MISDMMRWISAEIIPDEEDLRRLTKFVRRTCIFLPFLSFLISMMTMLWELDPVLFYGISAALVIVSVLFLELSRRVLLALSRPEPPLLEIVTTPAFKAASAVVEFFATPHTWMAVVIFFLLITQPPRSEVGKVLGAMLGLALMVVLAGRWNRVAKFYQPLTLVLLAIPVFVWVSSLFGMQYSPKTMSFISEWVWQTNTTRDRYVFEAGTLYRSDKNDKPDFSEIQYMDHRTETVRWSSHYKVGQEMYLKYLVLGPTGERHPGAPGAYFIWVPESQNAKNRARGGNFSNVGAVVKPGQQLILLKGYRYWPWSLQYPSRGPVNYPLLDEPKEFGLNTKVEVTKETDTRNGRTYRFVYPVSTQDPKDAEVWHPVPVRGLKTHDFGPMYTRRTGVWIIEPRMDQTWSKTGVLVLGDQTHTGHPGQISQPAAPQTPYRKQRLPAGLTPDSPMVISNGTLFFFDKGGSPDFEKGVCKLITPIRARKTGSQTNIGGHIYEVFVPYAEDNSDYNPIWVKNDGR